MRSQIARQGERGDDQDQPKVERLNREQVPHSIIRMEVGRAVFFGSRIASGDVSDLSSYIAGMPCLYFYVYEDGLYVGKTFVIDGLYQRFKAHMERWTWSRAGQPNEIIAIWNESHELSLGELDALEAAFIRHVPSAEQKNKNCMQICYVTDVRDEYLWSAYCAIRILLDELKLPVLDKHSKFMFHWRRIHFYPHWANRPSEFKYLADATRTEDTVVVWARAASFAFDKQTICWRNVRLPKTRHRRVRFIAFYLAELKLVSHVALIKYKHQVGENTGSFFFDLELAHFPLPIPLAKLPSNKELLEGQQSWALLESLLENRAF